VIFVFSSTFSENDNETKNCGQVDYLGGDPKKHQYEPAEVRQEDKEADAGSIHEQLSLWVTGSIIIIS
jgi:hypothetical protein